MSCSSHRFVSLALKRGRFGLNEREVLLSMATSKKLVLKRLLSMSLVVVMCFGFIPIHAQAVSAPSTLTNGMPVTEENVLTLIEEYRNGKEPGEKAKEAGFTSYQDGTKYDAYNPTYPGPGGFGTECAKFAFAFFDDLFGNVTYQRVTDPWKVRPGDLVHLKGHWAIAITGSHSVDWSQDPCICQIGGGPSGEIGWGNTDSTLRSTNFIEAYTRYPLPYEFEDSEVHLTSEGPIGTPLTSLEGLDSVRLEERKTN